MNFIYIIIVGICILTGCSSSNPTATYYCKVSRAYNEESINSGSQFFFQDVNRKYRVDFSGRKFIVYGMKGGEYQSRKLKKATVYGQLPEARESYDTDLLYMNDSIIEAFSPVDKTFTVSNKTPKYNTMQQLIDCNE